MADYNNKKYSRPFDPEVDDDSSRNNNGNGPAGVLVGIGLSMAPQPSGKENENSQRGAAAAAQSTQPTQQLAVPEVEVISHDNRGEHLLDCGVNAQEADAAETLSFLRSQGPVDADHLSVSCQVVEADTTAQGDYCCESIGSFSHPFERTTSRRQSPPPAPVESIPTRPSSPLPPSYEEATATPIATPAPITSQSAGSGGLFAPAILVRVPCVRSSLAGTIHFHPLFQWDAGPLPPRNLLKKIRDREGAVVFKLHPTNLIHTQSYVGSDRMHCILRDVEKQLMDIYNPWYLGWEGEYDSQRNRGTWAAEWRDPICEIDPKETIGEVWGEMARCDLAVAVIGLRNGDRSCGFGGMARSESWGLCIPPPKDLGQL